MNRACFLVCMAVASAAFASAQQDGSYVLSLTACPVNMVARQSMDGELMKTKNGLKDAPQTQPGQRIHLILNQAKAENRVVSATVKVSGLSARTRMRRSDSAALSADVSRTLNATFEPEGDNGVAAYLKLPGFTSVTSIQLISVNYADGSEWSVPQTKACTVTPDPLMLIAGR